MTKKIGLLQLMFLIWAGLLVARLFFWQIVKAQELSDSRQTQLTKSDILEANRGKILASDKSPLATNTQNFRLFVEPKKLSKNVSELLDILKETPSSQSAIENVIAAVKSEKSWYGISDNISNDTKIKIEKLNLSGLGFDQLNKRIYPEGSPSAYITGFVGRDEIGLPKGYFGLEGYYDRELAGIPGRRVRESDVKGAPILLGSNTYVPSQDGKDIETSIDRTVEFIAEKHLKNGIEKFGASGGTVTILDSQTGQVLSMVSLPSYNQEDYATLDTTKLRNPIVADTYEPGSTFKVVVMSSALDAKVVSPESICTICSGPVEISGKFIRSWDNNYYPNSTMSDIILHSDNVGMVFVGRKLGKEKMLEYIKKFGFGQSTNIDVQEETDAPLRKDSEWRELDISTTAFGQGIAVTPIQMVSAVNVIANRGKYTHPSIRKKSAVEFKSIISDSAASDMKNMMVNGVENGAVKIYKPKGYFIAGKTGTAQVPIEGHYDKDRVITSFVGFAPANNPKFTMLITLIAPQNGLWGSTTAAPIWMDIARELFRYYQIPPS